MAESPKIWALGGSWATTPRALKFVLSTVTHLSGMAAAATSRGAAPTPGTATAGTTAPCRA
eukprot:3734357-Pyramimonas_sp.AAC.1